MVHFTLKKVDKLFLVEQIKQTIPFGLASLFGVLYYRSDVLVLSKLSDSQHIGWYTASFRFLDSFVLFFSAFVNAVFPVLSKRFGSAELSRSISRSLEFIMLCTIPLMIIIVFLAPQIVSNFFGKQYGPSDNLLQILAFGLPFTFLNYFWGAALGAINKQAYHLYITILGVVINIGLNFILIRMFNATGAAITSLITTTLLCIVYTTTFLKNVNINFNWHFITRLILCSFVLLCILFLHLNFFLSLMFGGCAYISCLFFTKLLSFEEIKEMFLSLKAEHYAS